MKRLFLFCLFCVSITIAMAQLTIANAQTSLSGIDLVDDFPYQFVHCIGHDFIYNNKVDYTKDDAPYPYKNGRIMSGKYKSSNAAFNEYINSLKQLKDKKFKFIKVVHFKQVPEGVDKDDYGLLFAPEEGDSILYWISTLASSYGVEFISTDEIVELEKNIPEFKNKYLNKQFVYLGPDMQYNETDLSSLPLFQKTGYYTNKSNNMNSEILPMNRESKIPYSIWTLVNIQRKDKYIQVEWHNNNYGSYYKFGTTITVLDTAKIDTQKFGEKLYNGSFIEKNNFCEYLRKLVEMPNNNYKEHKEIEKELKALKDGSPNIETLKELRIKSLGLESEIAKLRVGFGWAFLGTNIKIDEFCKKEPEKGEWYYSFPYLEDLLNCLDKE